MYPISDAVKALFEAEQTKVLRITGSTVKTLPTDISVYDGDTLIYESGDGSRVKLYSGSTEVFDSNNGTQTVVLYSGDMPIYSNSTAAVPISLTITSSDARMSSFNVDRYSCNGDKLEIGTAIAAEMTINLDNHSGFFDGIRLEGTELFVEVGIADWSQENPTVNYIPIGYFTPDIQPRTAYTISLTCLDRMTKFDAVVDPTALTLPATVAGLVGQVCTICGVTLSRDISSLTNASVSIAALPTVQGDMTYRNLIQWCAGLMATNAWINWNGNLDFSWYNNSTSYTMTTANRYNSDLYENDLTVTGVTYTNNSGVEIVEGTDDYAIDLTGNALAGPLISTVLPAINTALNGFTYRPFSAAVINAPYLWPMDTVVFTDKNGISHNTVLTNVAFGLNGATALESRGMTYAMNAKKQPKGVTKEQAQIITQAMQAVETDIDESLTQQEIFNRLTDGGQNQGIYLSNGKVYVDATYILTGYLEATRIKGGTLTLGGLNNVNGTMEVLDASGNVVGTVTKNGFYAADTVNGAVRSATLADGMVSFKYDGQNTGRLLSGSTSGADYLLINGPDSSGSSVLSALDFWGDGSVHLAAGDQIAALDLHDDGSIGINSSDSISTTADGDISETAGDTLHLHSGGNASLYLTDAGNAELRSDSGAATLALNSDGSIGINSSDDIFATADGDISETADGTLHLHSGGDASLYLTDAGHVEIRSDGGASYLQLKADGTIYVNNASEWRSALGIELHELVLTSQTVDANGNIDTDLNAGNYVVMSARCSSYIVTPWVSGSTTTWWMHLTTFTGGAVSSGTNVGTVRVYYYDL